LFKLWNNIILRFCQKHRAFAFLFFGGVLVCRHAIKFDAEKSDMGQLIAKMG